MTEAKAKFDCFSCPLQQQCCHLHKVVLLSEEVEGFSALLRERGLDPDDHIEQRKASNGVVVYVVPKCPFFQNGQCTIYDERPLDCRSFPFIPVVLSHPTGVEWVGVMLSDTCLQADRFEGREWMDYPFGEGWFVDYVKAVEEVVDEAVHG